MKNAEDSSRHSNAKQLAWLSDLFAGLQRNGFTGVVKVHIHAGGIRGARKEEAIDLDWR